MHAPASQPPPAGALPRAPEPGEHLGRRAGGGGAAQEKRPGEDRPAPGNRPRRLLRGPFFPPFSDGPKGGGWAKFGAPTVLGNSGGWFNHHCLGLWPGLIGRRKRLSVGFPSQTNVGFQNYGFKEGPVFSRVGLFSGLLKLNGFQNCVFSQLNSSKRRFVWERWRIL